LARQFPASLAGIHLNAAGGGQVPEAEQTEEIRAWQRTATAYRARELDYFGEQQNKPQTVAFALADNPLGAAAWIVEKLKVWSDSGDDLDQTFTKDQVLTNVMLYWVTGAINSSFWPYWARRHEPWPLSAQTPVRAPTAYASFPKEILHPPRAWVEPVYPNLRRWTRMPKGGHFAAMEQPQALAREVEAFFGTLG